MTGDAREAIVHVVDRSLSRDNPIHSPTISCVFPAVYAAWSSAAVTGADAAVDVDTGTNAAANIAATAVGATGNATAVDVAAAAVDDNGGAADYSVVVFDVVVAVGDGG